MCYHDSVVDAESFIRGVDAAAAVFSHGSHHLLQPLVRSHATDDENLRATNMGHGAFHGLLQSEAQIGGGEKVRLGYHLGGQLVGASQDTREGAVHALDGVGKVQEHRALLGQLLNVVAGCRVVTDFQGAGEAVKAVADGDVKRLAKDAVPLLGVRDDLRVASADVQHDGVVGARDGAAHLDVADAVVDAHERLVPEQGERAGADGSARQRRPHPRPLCIANAVDLGHRDARVPDGLLCHPDEEGAVVRRRILGQEARPRGRDKGVPDVGEHHRVANLTFGRVGDDADAQLVCAAFASEGDTAALGRV
ncbi:hypothetical protein PoMZ_09965 [Pyricularia oryzae]|uniref:Uncharacterized protein n=1 Tax=Pyricularia oryzae TaxID=318829 RepID=A0A4P7MVZ8_PYROR|nr:hypothetical protein PoMZ_09965 [Pyricularia oryzae]